MNLLLIFGFDSISSYEKNYGEPHISVFKFELMYKHSS